MLIIRDRYTEYILIRKHIHDVCTINKRIIRNNNNKNKNIASMEIVYLFRLSPRGFFFWLTIHHSVIDICYLVIEFI